MQKGNTKLVMRNSLRNYKDTEFVKEILREKNAEGISLQDVS